MLSKAEPDASLKHLEQNRAPVWNTVWTLITLILIIALDIHFLQPKPWKLNDPLGAEGEC